MKSSSKFLPLYETIYNRYANGGGFLQGDLVKLKGDYKSCDCYKGLAENVKGRIEDINKSGYNLRTGRLHTPGSSQYGGYGGDALPPTHADIYQEMTPGNFGNLVTVPLEILEVVDTGVNLPPVSANNKRDPKETPYQKPTKAKANKDAITDEQTTSSEKQTHADKGDYDLALKNTKMSHGANDYDDNKPSNFKPLPKNKKKLKTLKESMTELENVYSQILTESPESDDAVVDNTVEVYNFLESHPEAVKDFVQEFGQEGWNSLVKQDINEVKKLLEGYGEFKAAPKQSDTRKS